MYWILFIILYNGNDGGHVNTSQIRFLNKKSCDTAKKQMSKIETKDRKGEPKLVNRHWYRRIDLYCIKDR